MDQALPNADQSVTQVRRTPIVGVTRIVRDRARSYDQLGRATATATTLAGQSAAASASGYIYNTAGQRDRQSREDGSVWQYGYDGLGQLSSGTRRWSDGTAVAGQQFGYSFDQIGNRLSATVNGRLSTSTANLLNQYATRTVPGAVDVLGRAKSEAVITVNGTRPARQGEYYAATVPVENAATPVDAALAITAVRNDADAQGRDAVTEQSGRVFVPKTPEAFTYDLDGNLTSDGRFNYTWDGENRLLAVESLASVPATAKIKLTFTYDAEGRRIEKAVFAWNLSTLNYELSTRTKFVYDGWNLLAELNASNQLQRSYTWGLDLSGTLQGAGGVGGLFALRDAPTATDYLATTDGNGNVTALVNATDATIAATYDYGPFGEPLRATGAMAALNPFRFSTHYTDQETGLVYAKRRYYSPSTGRWSSRDPIEEEGGLNLFGYVGNDPANAVDPFGESEIHINVVRYLYPKQPRTNIRLATIGTFAMSVKVDPKCEKKTFKSVSGTTMEPPPINYNMHLQYGRPKLYPLSPGTYKATRDSFLGGSFRLENSAWGSGVLIHRGSSPLSSEGCILVGSGWQWQRFTTNWTRPDSGGAPIPGVESYPILMNSDQKMTEMLELYQKVKEFDEKCCSKTTIKFHISGGR